MLVSEPVGNSTRRCYQCLDLLRVKFEGRLHEEIVEDAVLLEVWETGGLLQTDAEALPGCFIDFIQPVVRGQVNFCSKDDYGYLVDFTVSLPGSWFPVGYQPPYVLPKPTPLD